jgi:hypothetical protein
MIEFFLSHWTLHKFGYSQNKMVIYATNLIKYLINECLLKSMSTIVIIVLVDVFSSIAIEMT